MSGANVVAGQHHDLFDPLLFKAFQGIFRIRLNFIIDGDVAGIFTVHNNVGHGTVKFTSRVIDRF